MQYPGDSRSWSGRDNGLGPYKAAPYCKGDLPCHSGVYALDGDGAGRVELLIGLDNKQWLPAHVEDSWDPDDDMRLMRLTFGRWYMITDGWGRDLLPPDNAPDNQTGAGGGGVEPADTAQEVQLQEYQGWSQGTGSQGNGSRQGAANPGGK